MTDKILFLYVTYILIIIYILYSVFYIPVGNRFLHLIENRLQDYQKEGSRN